MNKFRTLWIAIIGLVLMNVGIMLWLWLSPRMGGREQQPFFLEKELSFTPEQIESYRQMRREHFDKIKEIRDSVKTKKEALLKQFTKNLSDEELWKISTDIESINIKVNVMTYKHLQAVYAMCTPEQKKKFDTMINEIAFQMSKPQPPPPRMGEGFGPPPHPDELGPPR